MKYKRYIFPILMGFTMSNIMSISNTGKILFPQIVVMMLLQAVVASAASLLFPAGVAGAKLTNKIVSNSHYPLFLILSSILPAIYFTAVLSISGLLRMKGYSDEFWHTYFYSLPLNIVYGYIVSIIWNIILDKTIKKMEKKSER